MESRRLSICILKRLHISSQIFFGHVFVTSFLRNGGTCRGGASYIYIRGLLVISLSDKNYRIFLIKKTNKSLLVIK